MHGSEHNSVSGRACVVLLQLTCFLILDLSRAVSIQRFVESPSYTTTVSSTHQSETDYCSPPCHAHIQAQTHVKSFFPVTGLPTSHICVRLRSVSFLPSFLNSNDCPWMIH